MVQLSGHAVAIAYTWDGSSDDNSVETRKRSGYLVGAAFDKGVNCNPSWYKIGYRVYYNLHTFHAAG